MRKSLLLVCACAVALAGCGKSTHTSTSTTALGADLVPDLLIQGGDPTGTGQGGPGYLTHDLPFTNTTYADGTVAMAKSGAQKPGTAGSQFFIVITPNSGLSGGEYALIGKVVKGLRVVDHGIGLLGSALSEQPSETVVIERETVAVTG